MEGECSADTAAVLPPRLGNLVVATTTATAGSLTRVSGDASISNMRCLLACVVFCTVSAGLFPALAQTNADGPRLLDPRIGVAQPQQFRALCSEEEWRNPLIDVHGDAVRVRSLSKPNPVAIPLSKLRQTLVELPVSDWPYGRIIAVPSQEHLASHHPESTRLLTDARHQIILRLRAGWWTYPHCENDRSSASLDR